MFPGSIIIVVFVSSAFRDADKNHDGYLSMEEYIRVFHEHGVNITAEEVALYFATKVW